MSTTCACLQQTEMPSKRCQYPATYAAVYSERCTAAHLATATWYCVAHTNVGHNTRICCWIAETSTCRNLICLLLLDSFACQSEDIRVLSQVHEELTFTCTSVSEKVTRCFTACVRPHYLNVTMLGFYRQNLNALRDCLIRQLLPGGPRGPLRGCKALLEGASQQWGDGD